MTNRIPQGADGWMRDVERRLLAVERRPAIASAAQILGPNISPAATQIVDWNSDAACFNGWVWSDAGSLNGPDIVRIWIGMVITTNVGHGMQIAYSHDPGLTAPEPWLRTFHRHGSGTVPFFSAWAAG
jgi:hypothetical protein